ncbi:MAG TPA: TIGR03619 family F420-dependent LLM class oxidoreductase [Candidatus Dormibacteraeota bacterium]|nr:TIGR03619 family F420-dependent LLM class oxidoreductase [Candidatus Dormibacteraeota bacterium]
MPSPAVSIVPPNTLVCGMQLPVAAQSATFVQPWEASAGAAEMRRVAEACEAAGLFYLAVSDHVAVPRTHAAAMSTVWYDAVATLGFLAAATRRIRLLSYVWVAPYRHPLVTAKAFATLDALSGGRVILGVGAGHVEAEFAALGVDFTRRGALLDEAIDLVVAAWSDEYPTHDGPTWHVRDLGQRPRPVQQPRPPIWIGGSTPPALRRAAERGDGWLPQGVPEMGMAAAIDLIRRHRQARRGDAPIDLGMNAPWLHIGRAPFEPGPNDRTGSPAELAEIFRGIKKLGVQHCGIRFRSRSCDELCDQVASFGADILPLINQ